MKKFLFFIIFTVVSIGFSGEMKAQSTRIIGGQRSDDGILVAYPNPTKETLNIHVSSALGLPNRFTISNSLGQIISRKAVSKQADLTVNTASLSNGVYFITVTKEDQSKTLQFVKE